MHAHYDGKADPVEAPATVQRAKNLIEEFFGLTVGDGLYMSGVQLALHSGHDRDIDVYECHLLSPTGRALCDFQLEHRRSREWVKISCRKGIGKWEQPLQVALDNFVNDPKGSAGALGEWKPDPGKLLSGR